MQHVKMSKSLGNVVTVDEVVYGVAKLAEGYDFRDDAGNVLDYLAVGVWRDPKNGFYFTASPLGRRPVFLHRSDDPVPARLMIGGVDRLQHPRLTGFWARMLREFEVIEG